MRTILDLAHTSMKMSVPFVSTFVALSGEGMLEHLCSSHRRLCWPSTSFHDLEVNFAFDSRTAKSYKTRGLAGNIDIISIQNF